MLNFIQCLDERILHLVRSSLASPFADGAMSLLSDRRCVFPLLALLFAYFIWKKGKRGRRAVLVLLLAVALTDVVASRILKPAFHRLRPYQQQAAAEGEEPSGSFSFPSSHSANIAAGATAISIYYPAAIPFTALLWALVSLSRVYLNAHYPSDCLGGLLLGMAIAVGMYYVVEYALKVVKHKWRWDLGPRGSDRKE